MWTSTLVSEEGIWSGKGRYFDGKIARPHLVDVIFFESSAKFVGDGISLERPFEAIRVRERSGEALELVFEDIPEAFLSITSVDAVNALARTHYAKVRRRDSDHRLGLIVVAALVMAAALFAFFRWGLGILTIILTSAIPHSAEVELGDALLSRFVDERQLAQSAELDEALRKCREVVRDFGLEHPESVEIHVVDDFGVVNAFALPGGNIVLYRGLLVRLESEEELFGLLAHEVGHVELRHGLRRLVRTSLTGLTFTMVFGDASGVAAVLVSGGSLLLNLAYNRSEEEEADHFALEAMQHRGDDPAALARLLEKLRDDNSLGVPELLSTHPLLGERIQQARRRRSYDWRKPPRPPVFSREEWIALVGAGEGGT